MLKVVAAILLFSFSVQCFQKGIIIMSYFTNKAIYTKSCENKFRPALNCEGKCVMMKKLLAEEEKQQKNPELKLENKLEVYELSASHIVVPSHSQNIASFYLIRSIGSPASFHTNVFHPPAA